MLAHWNNRRVARQVDAVLAYEEGRPLDSATRRFMEERFGHDLESVRIHLHPRADRLARTLNARAFTYGRNIVFAAGEYNPHTPAGQLLLAHELTHVLQQRAAARTSPHAAGVGASDDDYEREAAFVAHQVVQGGPVPAIRADGSGLVRRAVRVDPNSVKVTVNRGGNVMSPVAPGTVPHFPSEHEKFLHRAAFLGNAISATGTARLLGDSSQDSANDWMFGFIQVQWIETNWHYYRGQTNADGSMLLQRGHSPARPVQAARDVVRDEMLSQIWFNSSEKVFSGSKFPSDLITATFEDNPHDHCRLVEMNAHPSFGDTPRKNFLEESQLEFHFCNIFSARDPDGVFHHLAHFYWAVHWQARFHPASFTDIDKSWHVTPVAKGNGKIVSPVYQGGPSDPRFQGLITGPATKSANELSVNARELVESRDPTVESNIHQKPVWATFDVRR